MVQWITPYDMQRQSTFQYASDTRYANHNPCTTVYRLVRQLLGKDEGLNNELISKIDEN